MKTIMMSIRPEWVTKILNGEKTIEIRKKFPSDYVGWVYIYCTKDTNKLLHKNCADIWWVEGKEFQKKNKRLGIKQQPIYNGKVVARFWCDKAEEIDKDNLDGEYWKEIEYWKDEACLTYEELHLYLKGKNGYAIHITKLEIFDKPKEISEFYKPSWAKVRYKTLREEQAKQYLLTRAPQSYCFIEIGE